AILQSNYIPWKGYFDIIHDVDTFVFHDDLQYTKGDWRNRNRIKTAAGERWLTIPVGTSERRRICDVRLPGPGWARDHWRRIVDGYARAPFFTMYRDYFEALYLGREWSGLADMNQAFIRGIARDLLGLHTVFRRSEEFALTHAKGARVIELLTRLGAREYVSGPAARAYISDEAFQSAGLRVIWKDYSGYPEYPQIHPPFSHHVSILDLLFHTGPAAPWHIWGWRDSADRGAAA
ncbi:MAG: WbqC family protein, partial [Vicinamibacterales bacterium]